jgi:sn-1 stearoyl-lipid 9-desaturase
MNNVTGSLTAVVTDNKLRINWGPLFWIAVLHVGVLLVPFTFSWSGLLVCLSLYLLTGLGITMGYHRLLTHRSFQTPRIVEYFLTALGSLAGQGSPLQWVATHRAHHAHSDDDGDPHSPVHGIWWAHFLWLMRYEPSYDDKEQRDRLVKDLIHDPVHRFLDRFQLLLPFILSGILYLVGEWWLGEGLSWLVYGMFLRTCLVLHMTWLVNSATHKWGYRSHATKDQSTNLWWVALLTFGEGWHNNHHAYQRSAKHGLRWWEIDMTYWCIRLASFVKLARNIHVPNGILCKAAT